MSLGDLPSEVKWFIDTYIDSVEQLRILLLLLSQPERKWTISEITHELRSADSSISKRLEDLYARGVITQTSRTDYRHTFSPASEEIRTAILALNQVNQTKPYRVIEAIYSLPQKSLVAFAEAFKLRGKK